MGRLRDGLRAVATWTPGRAADRIGAEELARALAERPEDYLLVDVRSTLEFLGPQGHLPGALSMPWPLELRSRVHTLSPTAEQTVVLICFTGHRSRWAIEHVRTVVSHPVVDLEGGMIRWWEGGYPVVRG